MSAGNGSNNSAVVIGDNNGYGGDYQPMAAAQNGNGNRLTVIGSNNLAWAGADHSQAVAFRTNPTTTTTRR